MTIIDKLKNKENKKDENVKREPVGFNAILEECKNAYPDQLYPIHYGPMISWEAGGKFPLREVNVYETDEYYYAFFDDEHNIYYSSGECSWDKDGKLVFKEEMYKNLTYENTEATDYEDY